MRWYKMYQSGSLYTHSLRALKNPAAKIGSELSCKSKTIYSKICDTVKSHGISQRRPWHINNAFFVPKYIFMQTHTHTHTHIYPPSTSMHMHTKNIYKYTTKIQFLLPWSPGEEQTHNVANICVQPTIYYNSNSSEIIVVIVIINS